MQRSQEKKMKNRIGVVLVLLILIMAVCSGCTASKSPNEVNLYYLNQSRTGIVKMPYVMKNTGVAKQVKEILQQELTVPVGADSASVLPDGVELESYGMDAGLVNVYFNKAYGKMDDAQEVLARGAIVSGLLQIKGVDGVKFFVDGQELANASGKLVGTMTKDTFALNPGQEVNTYQETELTLYFATKDGTGLVKEVQTVRHNSNISKEKLVLERLLAGPKSKNAQAAIPTNTQLNSVSVMNGVCFVNLNEAFLEQNFKIQENVVIYSIVDSLAELSDIQTVQISVNGDTDMVYRESLSLSRYYKSNLNLIKENGSEFSVTQKDEQEGIFHTGN